jgi:membrane-bound serine protease (ClpP class)
MGPLGDAKDLLRPRSREQEKVDQGAVQSAPLRMFLLAALIMIGVFAAGTVRAQDREPADPPTVYVISVTGVIDLGLAPYMQRALDLAADSGAVGVIIEIDTPGGRLDAVIQMRDSLLNAKVPTVAFIDTTAFSAGALVAIASERIFMAPGAVIGAGHTGDRRYRRGCR